MGNQVRPRRGDARGPRTSERRRPQPRRRKVEMITLGAEAHCGTRRSRHKGGLRSLFRIGLVAALLLVPIVIATTTFGSTTTLDPPPDSPYWSSNAPQANGDPRRSGASAFDLLDEPPSIRWSVNGSAPFLAGPVMDKANTYVVDRKGVVTALNLTTGEAAWSADLKQEVRATPALAYGWLYVATEAKEVHALSAQSGTVIHSAKVGGAVRAAPLVAEGRVFIGTEAGSLEVLDATTLDLLWSFDTSTTSYANGTVKDSDDDLKKPIRSAPATYKGQVYFASWNARAYSLTTHGNIHEQPAQLTWSRTLNDIVHNAPVIDVHRDRVYLTTADGRLEAVYRSTGTTDWSIDAGDGFGGGVAVNKTHLIAATTDGRLLGVDPVKGKVLWQQYEPSGYIAAPTLLQDAVVTLSANGTLTFRSPVDGTPLASPAGEPYLWRLSDGAHATPAVTTRGVVAVDQGGTVTFVGPRPHLRADLSVSVKTVGNVTSTEPVQLSAEIRNHGPDLAPDATATLFLGDKAIDTLNVGRINATETRWWNHTITLSSGAHVIKVVVNDTEATDPTPADATDTLRLDIAQVATGQGNASSGAIDLEELYGRDIFDDTPPATASLGFLDGVQRSWTLWMLPIGLLAAAGGVLLGRYVRERGRAGQESSG